MVDKPTPPAPVETIPSVAGEVSAIASGNAPFIYTDGAATFGFNAGIANITLEAIRHMSVRGTVIQDRVVVAHLRMGPGGLKSLKDAVNGIELLATPTEKATSN